MTQWVRSAQGIVLEFKDDNLGDRAFSKTEKLFTVGVLRLEIF